jgi:hypothetical protein
MLDTVAPQMIKIDHPAPFMTFTFEVAEEWKTRVPEVVHEDGTSRAQVLKREYNPRYYDMMKALEVLTGNGVSLNTSLNRRGEPMICSPTDALNMFFGSDLQYLIMEDIWWSKRAPTLMTRSAERHVLQFCHGYDGPFLDCARQYASLFAGTGYGDHGVSDRGRRREVAAACACDEVLFMEFSSKAIRGLKLGAIGDLRKIAASRNFSFCIAHRFKPIYIALLGTAAGDWRASRVWRLQAPQP